MAYKKIRRKVQTEDRFEEQYDWDKIWADAEPLFKLGKDIKEVAERVGIPYTTLHSKIQRDESVRIKVMNWKTYATDTAEAVLNEAVTTGRIVFYTEEIDPVTKEKKTIEHVEFIEKEERLKNIRWLLANTRSDKFSTRVVNQHTGKIDVASGERLLDAVDKLEKQLEDDEEAKPEDSGNIQDTGQ